jgi:hypothetical protein
MNHYCSDVEHDHYTAMPRGENSPDTRGENSPDTRGENSSDKDLILDNGDENIDNGQKEKYKRTNKDLQNIHIKLKIE